MFGGENNSDGSSETLGALKVLDVESLVWFEPTVGGNEPCPRSGHSAVSVVLCVLRGTTDYVHGPLGAL